MNKKGIKEVLQTEMLDFVSPLLINNLPGIDGLLVSQRQVIWGMNKAGMNSKGSFYKMLKATGKIFDYYVLGDMPLCGVMKNMGNNYILNKYLIPKGSFGNKNSRNGDGASPRYIECKLNPYAEKMLEGINKNSIDLKWNYDSTEREPIILPSIIPNILTNLRMSISVSEANRMPSHNMNEVCDSIKSYIDTGDINKSIDILKCPDLPSGGSIIYNKETFRKIYNSGKGSFVNIGKYRYDEKSNTIIIYEIPYLTYVENIHDEIESNFSKFENEVEDFHNGSDRKGVSLELYLKKGANVDVVIQKLRKYTSYEKNFDCNFTILDLDNKTPKLCSLKDIYDMWITHRIKCITREYTFDLDKIREDLHLLYGLRTLIPVIDEVVKLIRSCKDKKQAIEKIMEIYNLDLKQSEYVASIQLVNLTQDYIQNKIKRIDILEKKEKEYTEFLSSEENIKNKIKEQLDTVKKEFGRERLTEIIYNDKEIKISKDEIIPDYNCRILLTQSLIKKHLRQSDSHKIKSDETIICDIACNNKDNLYLFTDKGNRYLIKCNDLQTFKPSVYGQSINSVINIAKDEKPIYITPIYDKGYMLFLYSNGNMAKINASVYVSNTKCMKAFNVENKIIDIKYIENDVDVMMVTSKGKGLIVNSNELEPKSTKSSKGNKFISLDGDSIIYSNIDIQKDDVVTIYDKEFDMSDIAKTGNKNETRTWYDYIKGRRGNKGNIILK